MPRILDATVGALDEVAPLVALGIEGREALAIGFVGDDGDGAAAFEKDPQVIGIVTLVADQPGAGRDLLQQFAALANGAEPPVVAMIDSTAVRIHRAASGAKGG